MVKLIESAVYPLPLGMGSVKEIIKDKLYINGNPVDNVNIRIKN